MKIYIQTRTKYNDYSFIKDRPSNLWWHPWLEFIDTVQSSILFQFENLNSWRLYISGIESQQRKDRVNTPIRYTLVLEENEKHIELEQNQDFLKKLIYKFFDQINNESKELSNLLDSIFLKDESYEWIDSFYKKTEPNDHNETFFENQKNILIESIINSLNQFKHESLNNELKSWYGDIRNHTKNFLCHIESTIQENKNGMAIYLNAIGDITNESLAKELNNNKIYNIALLLSNPIQKINQIQPLYHSNEKKKSMDRPIRQTKTKCRQCIKDPECQKMIVKMTLGVIGLGITIFVLNRILS